MNNKFEKGSLNLAFPQGGILPQESFLQIILRHRWTILVTTIFSLVVTFLYLLKATPIYTSLSRVYVEQSGPKIINEYEGLMTRSGNYLYTQSELLMSTSVLGDAVDDTEIRRLKTFAAVNNLVG